MGHGRVDGRDDTITEARPPDRATHAQNSIQKTCLQKHLVSLKARRETERETATD
jgi:hypothetical protein